MSRASTARKSDGAERPVEMTAAAALQVNTLKGDIRDQILDVVRGVRKPWDRMGKDEQRVVVNTVTTVAGILTNEAVRIVAARGFEPYEAIVNTFKIDPKLGIVVTIVMPNTDEGLVAINQRRSHPVLLVPHDLRSFHGERAAVPLPGPKPEVVRTEPTTADGQRVDHDAETGEVREEPKTAAEPTAATSA